MSELDRIKEEVEQRLQSQQANKEFKDIGRVAQTKKEKSAYKIISSKLLTEIELDPVMAYNMIKKDNVWGAIDINQEREKGVTSGGAFLKVKIRESAPTRPKDDVTHRAIYVRFLEKLQSDLSECFNVQQVIEVSDKYRSLKVEDVISNFMFPEYETADESRKAEIKSIISKNSNLRIAMIYGGNTFFRKMIKEVFSAKFENMLFFASDSALTTRNEAREKEPISEEKSKEIIDKLTDRHEQFLSTNKLKLEEYKSMTPKELSDEMKTSSMSSFSKDFYKNNLEGYRTALIESIERRIAKQTEFFKQNVENAKPRGNNWDWFDVKKEKAVDDNTVEKPKKRIINTKTPLSYIKRTGGVKIDVVTPKEIVDKFGFSAVNYGNYVDDVWSKQHTQHFLGAISDLGEILNFDIKKINELGKLSIAFGSKGTKGALATYFPQTKDINLTKSNGDGSVAHEWGHYFDNVIVEKDLQVATNRFGSQGYTNDFRLKNLFKELMDFFYKGKEGITPKLKFVFYPGKQDYAPTFSRRVNGDWTQVTVELKSTVEETIKQYEWLCVAKEEYYSTQVRVFGYILKSFGLDSYEIDIQLGTSYFYHKSAYNFFEYCYRDPKKGIVKGGSLRTQYWTSAVELFARAWETVVLKKLIDAGRESNYLVADVPMDDIISAYYFEPYPSGKELEYIESIIDKIIEAVKETFSIGDFVATSNSREDVFVDLSKNGKQESGIKIDKKKGDVKKDVEFIEGNKIVEEVTVEEEPKSEQSIQELIEGFEVMAEMSQGAEKKEYEELIEGLKLLASL